MPKPPTPLQPRTSQEAGALGVMKTERDRQLENALKFADRDYLVRFHFECSDGEKFSAVAHTDAGALRVLTAERPGITARFIGTTWEGRELFSA